MIAYSLLLLAAAPAAAADNHDMGAAAPEISMAQPAAEQAAMGQAAADQPAPATVEQKSAAEPPNAPAKAKPSGHLSRKSTLMLILGVVGSAFGASFLL